MCLIQSIKLFLFQECQLKCPYFCGWLNSSVDEVIRSMFKTTLKAFNNLQGLWKLKYTIVNWHLQSRRPQSCHVQSRAGHRKRPRGHLWRRGQPARGPLAPLSVWTTALWAGHGLSARDHTLIHTTAAATATRYPRWARHWPPWPRKQNSEEGDAQCWTRLWHLFPSSQLCRSSSIWKLKNTSLLCERQFLPDLSKQILKFSSQSFQSTSTFMSMSVSVCVFLWVCTFVLLMDSE